MLGRDRVDVSWSLSYHVTRDQYVASFDSAMKQELVAQISSEKNARKALEMRLKVACFYSYDFRGIADAPFSIRT